MGCSMGGRIVLHLALKFPNLFKTVIALEGADKLDPYYDLEWLNRPDILKKRIEAGAVVESTVVIPLKD